MDIFQSFGFFLSVEQRSAIKLSLPILKKDGKYAAVGFWGVIRGKTADYLVVRAANGPLDVKFYFSSDMGITWASVPDVTAEQEELIRREAGLFEGQPGHIYGADEEEEEPEEDDEQPKKVSRFSEVDRLGYVLKQISHEVRVAPRGFYLSEESGVLTANRHFEGLDQFQAAKLENWFHVRSCRHSAPKAGELDSALEIGDQAASDEAGTWNAVQLPLENATALRSLLWPGYVAVVTPEGVFDEVYFGNGVRNEVLQFMLR